MRKVIFAAIIVSILAACNIGSQQFPMSPPVLGYGYFKDGAPIQVIVLNKAKNYQQEVIWMQPMCITDQNKTIAFGTFEVFISTQYEKSIVANLAGPGKPEMGRVMVKQVDVSNYVYPGTYQPLNIAGWAYWYQGGGVTIQNSPANQNGLLPCENPYFRSLISDNGSVLTEQEAEELIPVAEY